MLDNFCASDDPAGKKFSFSSFFMSLADSFAMKY